MRKTSNNDCDNKITVNLKELQTMLSLGRHSADKIGTEAGAVVRIGKRKVYNVEKIQNYINSIAGGEN